GGHLAFRRDVPLLDAGARGDPLVVGVEPTRQVVVGHDLLGQIGARRQHLRAQRAGPHQPAAACGLGAAVIRSISVRMRSLTRWTSRSTATPTALAKPIASVPPWLLITMPFRPRNMAPL